MKIRLIISLIIAPFLTVSASYAMLNNDTIKSIDCDSTGKILICRDDAKNSTNKIQLYNTLHDLKNNKFTEWNPKNTNQKPKPLDNVTAATFTDTNAILLHYQRAHTSYKQDGDLEQSNLKLQKFNPIMASSKTKKATGTYGGNIEYIFDTKKIMFTGHLPISIDERSRFISVKALDFNKTGELLAVGFANGCVKVYATETIEKQKEIKDFISIEPILAFNDFNKSDDAKNSISAIKFGPDNTVITGHTNGNVEVHNLSNFFSSLSTWWAKNKTLCLWTGIGITLYCAITLALKYKFISIK